MNLALHLQLSLRLVILDSDHLYLAYESQRSSVQPLLE